MNLSPHLLKPTHPIHRDVAFNIAFKLTTSLMILLTGIFLTARFAPTPLQNPWMLLLAAPAVLGNGIGRSRRRRPRADLRLRLGRRELGSVLQMTLTSAECPLQDDISEQAAEALDGIVDSFRINWVWMPPGARTRSPTTAAT